MSKPLLIALVVLLVGGVAWFFLMPPIADAPTTDEVGDQTDSRPAASPTTEEGSGASFEGGTGTFAELVGQGEALRCSFRSAETDGTVATGNFYTDGERFRVQAETTYDGGTASSNMLTDGTTTYVWSDTPDGSFAFTMPTQSLAADTTAPSEPAPGAMPVTANETVEYDCEQWSIDEDRFAVPADVEFTDMQAMMQGMFEGREFPQ